MDDIAFELLLRLPPRSVSRFKDVSPRWSHMINSSIFQQIYAKRWRGELNFLGFFIFNTHSTKWINGTLRQLSSYWWPSTSTTTTQVDLLKKPADFLKDQGMGYFITTCNGLVLSGCYPKYYVCNPVTTQYCLLPKPPSHFLYDSVAFWSKDSDNNLSINFKVIWARICSTMSNTRYRSICIEIFCSKTRVWTQTTLKCSSPFLLMPYNVAVAVTTSGVICWKARDKKLAIHNLKQEGGTGHLTLIQDPQSSNDFIHNSYGESSDGRLQYGECDSVCIKIFVLDKLQEQHSDHYNYKWNLSYKISFSSMLTNNPTIYGGKEFIFVSLIPQNSESIYIGSDKFFLYHLSTGKMEAVPYHGGHSLNLSTQGQEASKFYTIEPYYERLWPDLSF